MQMEENNQTKTEERNDKRTRSRLWRLVYGLVLLLGLVTVLFVLFITADEPAAKRNGGNTAGTSGEEAGSTEEASENISTEPSSEPPESTVPSESAESSTTAPSSEPTTEPTTEEPSTTPDPYEGMTPDEILRHKAIEKFENLGTVVDVNNYLNVRAIPSTEGEVVGVIFDGCCADLLEHQDGWYKISSGGATGYVSDRYIATGDEAKEIAMAHCRYVAHIKAKKTNVMDQPNEDSPVLTPVVKGDHYDCLEELDGWVGIDIVQDKVGYIKASSCEIIYLAEEAILFSDAGGASQVRRNIINTALQYYGGKYVFGGTSLTEGIDCSAFTQQIFAKNGITLTRNSWTQGGEGKHVDLKKLRPGDLVFYPAAHKEGIGHVAIYMGNGKIIHAASKRLGITVSDLKISPILDSRDVIGD
ncbi:MAG: C40 family peptidase [Lachnospiraceae bacterium]|nr:C40 family peptidase [Lachnospiraceae bacterium]